MVNYEISLRRAVSSELYGLALLETELPEQLEQFLLAVKHDLEGSP